MYQELRDTWDELTQPGQMFELTTISIRGADDVKAFANIPGSLRDVWEMTAGHGQADYLVYEDERWTYEEAHQQVQSIAAWLTANGVQQHDRVAIAMRNYPEWMLAYWAVISMGAVAVGMNAWWVPEEMDYGLADSAPKALICDKERLQRFSEIAANHPDIKVVAVRCEDELPAGVVSWSELISADPVKQTVEIDPDDDACVFYTSGTTGRPKGAQLTHRGCVTNLFAVVFANMAQSMAAAKVSPPVETDEAPVQQAAIIATPLFHVTANNCLAQALTLAGGKLLHMYKWDAGEALRIIEAEKITTFTGVPVMSREMMNHPDYQHRDTSSLKSLGGGGAPVQPDLVDKIDKNGGNAAPSQGYGMTEVCGIISAVGGAYFVDKPKSAGLVMPTFDIKCVDEDGKEVPLGERGEVCVKGAQVIKGYLNRPEATAEAIVDGWLATGDIGYLDDDGFLYLVDRAKDMVLRGGENVYCSEVETVLFSHDDVAECAVFSVPDDRLGEEVGAAIYLTAGKSLTAEELREFCKVHLSAYKIPRYIWMMDEQLPRNASGKFLKKELQKELLVVDAS
ncbi:AMP-dependent synthetase [Halieaceae bacterium IMCC14734]|uniref:AMP-dependent synthetase n=1 Tax=Candidatus Litorirhabdus singularis TaxID=2518993 RepID=A0ABT3TFQ9_9GAMM|nr:class I adenylate-forming enzyme family protein [Candidatus Litorirhabdus singularis]MCX2981099.1 AMP-dependent synthetase [Candidatus Litorirhabdus singularis]